MKTLLYIIAATSLMGCSEAADKNASAGVGKDTTQPLAGAQAATLSARKHAEAIIAGKIRPGDDEATVAWLDSLQSPDIKIRNYAFRVYKAISLQSDGALGETVCGYVKDYFAAYPKEALVNYATLNKVEKRQTVENLAFEFSMNGKAYQASIDEYFNAIEKECRDCQEQVKERLLNLRKAVEAETKLMVVE